LEEIARLNQSNRCLQENYQLSGYRIEEAETQAERLQTEATRLFNVARKAKSILDQKGKELEQQNEEVRALREQLIMLKADRSASSRQDEQLSDDAIRSGMNSFYYGIRDWALEIVRDTHWSGSPANSARGLKVLSNDAD